MQYTQGQQGRVFVLRLEHGETVHEVIETFAREKQIKAAAVIAVGGADAGSCLVVGPEAGDARPVVTMTQVLEQVHEIAGTGTLFPDGAGNPVLHMHMACGRNGKTITGCIRSGVRVWQILELVILELIDVKGARIAEPDLGFNLLKLQQIDERGEE